MQDHNKARIAEAIEEIETATTCLEMAAKNGSFYAVGAAQAKLDWALRLLRAAAKDENIAEREAW